MGGPTGHSQILAYPQAVVKKMVITGKSGVETLVIGVAAHSVVIHIIDGERGTSIFASTGKGEVVVLHQSCGVDFLCPIRVCNLHSLVAAGVGLGNNRSIPVAEDG